MRNTSIEKGVRCELLGSSNRVYLGAPALLNW